MAKEEIAFSVSVDAGDGAKSLKSLKQEFKDTQKELDGLTVGTKEYVQTLSKLGGIRDEIGDLNDEINAFNPEGKVKAFGNVIGGLASGFQAAQGAAALFGGESKALEKTLLKVQAATAFAEGIKGIMGMGDAFKVLGNILKANPIMLIATIVIGIGAALYELKDKLGVVGKAFDAVGKFIDGFIQGLKDVGDFLGITNFKMQAMADSIIKNSERIKTANNSRYDAEIAAAKRAGKETELIEIEKLNAITKTNDEAIKQLRIRQQESGSLSEDDKKKLDDLVAENKSAYSKILDLSAEYKNKETEHQKELTDKYKQELEKRNQARIDAEKALQALIASENKSVEDLNAQTEQEKLDLEYNRKLEQFQKLYDAAKKAGVDEIQLERLKNESLNAINDEYALKQKAIDDANAAAKQAKNDADYAAAQERDAKEVEDNKKKAEQKAKDQMEADDLAKKHREETLQQGLALTDASLNAAKGLSDLYFAGQAKKAKGNAAAELALKKKQFKVDKAFNIVRATIDGIRSVQAALTQSPPLSYALAAVNAVMAGANIAKIASAKFEGGESGGGGGTPSLGSAGGGVPITPPSNGSTLLNPDGSIKGVDKTAPTVKAVVVETDITKTQKRVGSIESKAKL